MIRIFLRALNGPLLLLLVAIALAIQSSLFFPWPLPYFQPDIVLLILLWCALQRGFEEGGIIVLISANMNEIHSAAPQGLFLIGYMGVYLMIRAASRYVIIPNRFSFGVSAIIGSLLLKAITWFVLYLLGTSLIYLQYSWLSSLFGAAVDGAFCFACYGLLEKFDWMTYKSVCADQALDDELQFKHEGI